MTDDTSEVQNNHKLNIDNLRQYIRANFTIKNPDNFEIRQFIHGQSNPTFYINYDSIKLVLRKKPPGKLLKSAHMIEREFRIITALFKKGFPVPQPYLYCTDESIIGTEFYLMEFIDGVIIRDIRLYEYSPDERYKIYTELIRVAALLHSYNPEELGLVDYGKGSGFCERQIGVWTRQYKDSETQKIEEMDKLIDWLPKNIPSEGDIAPRIIHGDLRLENVIFDRKELKIKAVLDWELSTLGNPMTDLSYICLPYHFGVAFFGLGNFDKGSYGIPSEEEMKEIYFNGTGFKKLSKKDWLFYLAFSCFRLAGIAQGVYKRSLQGNASSPYANTFKEKTILVAKNGYRISQTKIDDNSRIADLKKLSMFKFLNQHLSEKFYELYLKLLDFMNNDIYPAEKIYHKQVEKDNWKIPNIIFSLRKKAQTLGLCNLFLPDISGLSNLEYAYLCELMGRSLFIAPEVCNCGAPDTGNMELLHKYADNSQKEKYLRPLLNGDIKSCFAMTEKGTASSDATNIQTTIKLDKSGEYYIINGRKWFASGAGDPRCKFAIVMGKSEVNNKFKQIHNLHSMIIVEMNTPGVRILRPMTVFGYNDAPHGHMDIMFDNVKVPKANIILGEGKGFEIAQGRLGPGRIHHCMRLIGMAERALDALLHRITYRKVFGKLLMDNDYTIKQAAKCKLELDQARLLVLYAAYRIDQGGAKEAKHEIAMIKVVVPNIAIKVLERTVHIYGAEGFSQDTFLASYYAFAKTLRIADGPDEVHLDTIGKSLIREKLMPKF
jgi:alkylation response protein AidB-like acyl-CoA dehydrogenase/aminoglycoside phosphotransferase (APT) family kinase protein